MSCIKRVENPEMKWRAALLAVAILLSCSLSGCMYPSAGQQPGSNPRDSVKRVQAAVDDYQREVGLLPILNADEATPRYEKFVINLEKLHQDGYLDEIPAVAFEKGGSAYFLVLDEEEVPSVKLMDLVTVQKVNDIQRQVDRYKSAHGGESPAGAEKYPGLFIVDSKQAGTASLTLKSIYSGQPLEFIMDRNGTVYADYSFDIKAAINKAGGSPKEGIDLRHYLESASYYVPVKSLPYLWKGSMPVPQPPQQ